MSTQVLVYKLICSHTVQPGVIIVTRLSSTTLAVFVSLVNFCVLGVPALSRQVSSSW